MAGTADPSHDELSAARTNPYVKPSEEEVAAGEVRLAAKRWLQRSGDLMRVCEGLGCSARACPHALLAPSSQLLLCPSASHASYPPQAKLSEIEAAIRRRSIDKLSDELVGCWEGCAESVGRLRCGPSWRVELPGRRLHRSSTLRSPPGLSNCSAAMPCHPRRRLLLPRSSG